MGQDLNLTLPVCGALNYFLFSALTLGFPLCKTELKQNLIDGSVGSRLLT